MLDGASHMSEEQSANAAYANDIAVKVTQKRQRSTVAFSYIDLDSVTAVAVAIHDHVGTGSCDETQLSAWLDKSVKSSGFRGLLSAARLFGLIDIDGGGQSRLTAIGRKIVDPSHVREAKVKAFLSVPLYKAVYERYKGEMLPPAAALEREIVQIGVAEKQQHTARLVFERSAQSAGFSEHGKDRLVMPGFSSDAGGDDAVIKSEPRSDGGGGEPPRLDPLIAALIQKLPPVGTDEWPVEARVMWLQMAAMAFQMAYGSTEPIEIKVPPNTSDILSSNPRETDRQSG
jgi:hypothetical protein